MDGLVVDDGGQVPAEGHRSAPAHGGGHALDRRGDALLEEGVGLRVEAPHRPEELTGVGDDVMGPSARDLTEGDDGQLEGAELPTDQGG